MNDIELKQTTMSDHAFLRLRMTVQITEDDVNLQAMPQKITVRAIREAATSEEAIKAMIEPSFTFQ